MTTTHTLVFGGSMTIEEPEDDVVIVSEEDFARDADGLLIVYAS